MAVETINFTTGTTTLPDVGELSYNGCRFSPLYETKVSGKVIQDAAKRTTMYMEYTLTADGYVTLPSGASDINPTMITLRNLLTAQGGTLVYKGRGMDFFVNSFGAAGPGAPAPGEGGDTGGFAWIGIGLPLTNGDVAWGPVPTLLEFQPLGGGRSAKVQWQVVVRVTEVNKSQTLLQLNYETTVSYGEDGYSSLSVSGTMEVPMTRLTSQKDRTVPYTVDKYRDLLDIRIFKGIDLRRFRVTNREFNVSRDKRVLEFSITAEEIPYMQSPADCTIARGMMSTRPTKVGPALASWICTLKVTYTVRPGAWRRTAWDSFLSLLRLRMNAAIEADPPSIDSSQESKKPGLFKSLTRQLSGGQLTNGTKFSIVSDGKETEAVLSDAQKEKNSRRPWLIDLSIEEGLFLDSKTVTFSAAWRFNSKFSHILLASGLWRKLPERDGAGNNLWATSMKDISGSQSWLPNRLDPNLDVIVDFGGPDAL